jgi:polar amino acid transport system substrate-binding protein
MLNPRRHSALLPAALVLALATACSSGSDTAASDSASGSAKADLSSLPKIAKDAELAGQVPADVKAKGTLTVATSTDSPPMSYVGDDNKTIVGFDIDMSRAIASTLGLKAKVMNAGFDSLIPGLQAKRYDLSLASIGVTAERERVVDFVSYYNGGQAFLASTATTFKVKTLADLCGHKVAVSTGSSQQYILEDEAGTCAKAGKKPWTLQKYPNANAAVLAIGGNRVEVLYGSISIIEYTAAQNSKAFRVAGHYKRALVGAALTKGSALAPVVQKAIQHLIDDGIYTKLLDKWGLSANAVKKAEINSKVS